MSELEFRLKRSSFAAWIGGTCEQPDRINRQAANSKLLINFFFFLLKSFFLASLKNLDEKNKSNETEDKKETKKEKKDKKNKKEKDKEPKQAYGIFTVKDISNIRRQTNTDSEIVATIQPGTQIERSEIVGEWSKVSYGEYQGYILTELLDDVE